jgi:hypothetical protein
VLLAIPAAAAIQIILREWWSYRQAETTPPGGIAGPGDTTAAGADDATPDNNRGLAGDTVACRPAGLGLWR